MIVKLGAALSLQVHYLQLRGTVYQFRIRVPHHLVHHYGKLKIRKSLGTSDFRIALTLGGTGSAEVPRTVPAAFQRHADHASRCRYSWQDDGRTVGREFRALP